MDLNVRSSVWQQFGAAIDMLDDSLLACPDELWSNRSENPVFWYIAYHTLFWLDLYLSGSAEGFAPPAQFTLDELDPNAVLPDQPYSKDDLHAYLVHCRQKCQATIEGLSDDQATRPYRFRWGDMSFFELLLYTMRHVQEHGGQLSLILGQKTGWEARWVARARDEEGI